MAIAENRSNLTNSPFSEFRSYTLFRYKFEIEEETFNTNGRNKLTQIDETNLKLKKKRLLPLSTK
jgi:hypothetical protein